MLIVQWVLGVIKRLKTASSLFGSLFFCLKVILNLMAWASFLLQHNKAFHTTSFVCVRSFFPLLFYIKLAYLKVISSFIYVVGCWRFGLFLKFQCCVLWKCSVSCEFPKMIWRDSWVAVLAFPAVSKIATLSVQIEKWSWEYDFKIDLFLFYLPIFMEIF